MPFSKHHIDPAHIEAMRAAFKKVCDTLLLKCDADDPMTEIIVTKIVALAKAGERVVARVRRPCRASWAVNFARRPELLRSTDHEA
jgi:hypothetical protein